MNPDNKCFLSFLHENNLLIQTDNVIYARNAFKIHGAVSDMIRQSRGMYESKEDFLSKINIIDCIIQEEKNIPQYIDKPQYMGYTEPTAKVEAPTSIKLPTTSVPVPAPARITAEQMLDRWLYKE